MAKATGHGGRDGPDYGVSDTIQSKTSFSDLSELAVRLGSPVKYERSGIVMAIDTFKSGYGDWLVSVSASPSNVTLSGLYSVTEPYSVRLHVEQAPSATAQIIRDFPLPYVASFGLEVSFLAKGDFEQFFVSSAITTGTAKYTGTIYIDNDNNKLGIYEKTLGYTDIADLDITFDATTGWVVAKLVFDLASEKYVRALVNMQSYDLSEYSLFKSVSADNPSFGVFLYLTHTQARSESVWVDNVILTVNEPI